MEWVTCRDPYEEVWSRLLEFTNSEFVKKFIHDRKDYECLKGQKNNINKQVKQIRFSLLQAKEYFDAAKNSSLMTCPNHIYYGSVALSTACMLLRGDGRKSLDYLRRDKGNAKHGLHLIVDESSLLEKSKIEICKVGHFVNWYEELEKKRSTHATVSKFGGFGRLINMQEIGCYEIDDFSKIDGMQFTLLDLMKKLPDLFHILNRVGIEQQFVRGELVVDDLSNGDFKFLIHEVPKNISLDDIFNNFKCDSGVMFCYEMDYISKTGLIRTRLNKSWEFSACVSRESLDHESFFLLDLDKANNGDSVCIPEVAELFLVSYGLSMLSRYYPDIWVDFLESNSQRVVLVKKVVELLMAKFPNLILNEIEGRKINITSYRPTWS